MPSTIRYIIRPSNILTTPRLLKEAFRAKRTIAYPLQSNRKPSILKDFFLTYPSIEETEEYAQIISNTRSRTPLVQRTISQSRLPVSFLSYTMDLNLHSLENYSLVREFFTKNKPQQRAILCEFGFSVPWTCYKRISFGQMDTQFSRTFVRRPIRHRAGSGWNILTSEESQNISQRPNSCSTQESEYIQQVLPKDYEYRIIVCKGIPLITLLKRNTNNLSPLEPWNHQHGSSFVTVENQENNRLRHTDIYQKIEATELFKHIDLCALDVIYLKNPHRYYLLELNFCPGLTIQSNIEKVKNHVLQVL